MIDDILKRGKCLTIIVIMMALGACKKEAKEPTEDIISPQTGTRTQFTLDSIYLYARQLYLWNDALPAYSAFNPRQKYAGITPDLTAFSTELYDISQLKINTATGKPYENPVVAGSPKYSFLELGSASAGQSAGVASGTAVQASAIITAGTNQVAYVALGSFPELSQCQSELDQVFSNFAAVAPKYLVVDLRYNGGGYVATAQYVANLISTTTMNGKVMFSELFNSQMQAGTATILKHQPYLDGNGKVASFNGRAATMADVDYTEATNTYHFEKKGSLNSVSEVYFITSGKTASASELLISCLKPYFKVSLVGQTTYGKPVGFFAINIDQYSVYLSSFLIRNAQGWSAYFDGMQPDVAVTANNTPVLGDPNEACLSRVLQLIGNNTTATGATSLAVQRVKQSATPQSDAAPVEYTAAPLIENRLKLKKDQPSEIK